MKRSALAAPADDVRDGASWGGGRGRSRNLSSTGRRKRPPPSGPSDPHDVLVLFLACLLVAWVAAATLAACRSVFVPTPADGGPNNPHEGWQPLSRPEDDGEEDSCASWRACFEGGDPNDRCHGRCRDGVDAWGDAPPPPLGGPEDGWIPDVTVLRRMLLRGTDAEGRPWPPPLVTPDDRELCEPIGNAGGRQDVSKQLFDAVPIRGMPLVLPSDSAAAAATAVGGGPSHGDGSGPRILCMVYTMESAHATKVRAIRETWGPGCDGFLAFSTKSDPRIPAISLPHEGPEEYGNMWQKVRSIWAFVGRHYLDGFDYFLLGGDDLYVLPQNLRRYLATAVADPDLDDYFGGRRFRRGKSETFNSGGAGYVLSRATLRKLAQTGLDHIQCNPHAHTPTEDVMVANCLRRVFGVGLADTRDGEGRERFHPFAPATHYTWSPPVPPQRDWFAEYTRDWPPLLGRDCCAPDSVSFHYIKRPAMVRHLHALLYFCDQ